MRDYRLSIAYGMLIKRHGLFGKSLKLLSVMMAACLITQCHVQKSEETQVKTSVEARLVLGRAHDLPNELVTAIDSARVKTDWFYQRQSSWLIWNHLLGNVSEPELAQSPGLKHSFAPWESWYSKEDFERIFQHLYQGLGPEGRRLRLSFEAAAIEKAILWNDEGQFLEPSWNSERFERWLAKYDTPDKTHAIPGINKILMNTQAMMFLLNSYRRIDSCFRNRPEPCSNISLPRSAAFLKTAWRRGQDGFSVPYFSTDGKGFQQQWQESSWTKQGSWVPPEGQSLAFTTPTGQKFHLAGMHLMLKLESSWLWSSLWLDPQTSAALTSDQPKTMHPRWQHYQMCSVSSFDQRITASPSDVINFPSLAKFADEVSTLAPGSWCSNPFLESGINNQKTSCLGCHQHAGSDWMQSDFNQMLEFDLPAMQLAADPNSETDFVWSLFTGPDAFAFFVNETVDYYDIYDLD